MAVGVAGSAGGSAACRQPLDTHLGSPAVERRLTHYTAPGCKEEIVDSVWKGYRILSDLPESNKNLACQIRIWEIILKSSTAVGASHSNT